MLKPLHVQWLIDLYNYMMTTTEGKNVVLKGWKSAGIAEAIQKVLSNLPALDPFNDIDPMINFDIVELNLEAVIDKTAEDLEMLGAKTTNDDDMDDDDYEEVMHLMLLMTILSTRQTICNMLLLNVVFRSFFILLYRKMLNN